MPTISICIPTYNRSKYLAELLNSIISQGYPDIEVIVSDDASPDDTPQVVKAYQTKLQHLKYIRQSKNIGLDKNFYAVAESAAGDYIWFMGDDDRLEPDALKTVTAALDNWPDITGMTLGVIDYDAELRQPVGIRSMPPTQRLGTAEEVFTVIPDLLGFMSALVIKRTRWLQVFKEDPVQSFENLYVQVYILGRALQRVPGWGILNTPCVGFRTSNDQFGNKHGWFKRMQFDVVAYDQIALGLFRDHPSMVTSMRNKIFRAHVIARVNNAKTSEGRTPEIFNAGMFLLRKYWAFPIFWIRVVPTLLMPKAFMRTVRKLYQKYSPTSGTSRAKGLMPK